MSPRSSGMGQAAGAAAMVGEWAAREPALTPRVGTGRSKDAGCQHFVLAVVGVVA